MLAVIAYGGLGTAINRLSSFTRDHRWYSLPRPIALSALIIASVPVWWILGLDQAGWLVAASLLGLYALRSQLPVGTFGWLSLGFVGVALLSGILTAEGIRQLSLIRDLLIIVAFFAVLHGVRAFRDTSGLATVFTASITVFLSASAIVSLLAFALQDGMAFTAPIAPLVPDIIASTQLGEASLIERSFGTTSYLFGIEFLRPDGFFLFSTSQAVGQATFIPILIRLRQLSPRWRGWLSAAIVLNALSLIATTTRASMLAVLFGLVAVWVARRIVVGYVRIEIPLNLRTLIVIGGVMAAAVVVAFPTGLADDLTKLMTARSGDTRSNLYSATIDKWAQQPLLGWGTELDLIPTPTPDITPSPTPTPTPTPRPTPSATPTPPLPEDLPPLGSHSQYLGVLFKQGIVGALIFVGLSAYLIVAAAKIFRSAPPGGDLLVAALLTALVSGATEEWWLDPATALIVATVAGFVLREADHLKRQGGSTRPQGATRLKIEDAGNI